jgi:hypothetical protein
LPERGRAPGGGGQSRAALQARHAQTKGNEARNRTHAGQATNAELAAGLGEGSKGAGEQGRASYAKVALCKIICPVAVALT